MQRHALKLAVGTAAVAAALMYLGASGEARQAPQAGGGGRGGARGAAPAPAAADAELHTLHVQGNVYMLVGAGGNIAVQIGDDGVLLVDTGLAANADKVVAAVRTLSNKPIRYIVNTHVHPDHVGGNDAIGKLGSTIAGGNVGAGAGVGAGIIAHENVLNRMSAPTGQQAPFPTTAWPTDTYISKQKELFFNGESLQIIHQPAAHTDGSGAWRLRLSGGGGKHHLCRRERKHLARLGDQRARRCDARLGEVEQVPVRPPDHSERIHLFGRYERGALPS